MGQHYMYLDYVCSEGKRIELHNLEELLTEGDADDGNAEDGAKNSATNRFNRATESKPYNVCDRVRFIIGVNILTEGEEGKFGKAEENDSKWDTNDCYTEDNTCQEVRKSSYKTEGDKPKEITDSFHSFSPKYNLISIFYTIFLHLSIIFLLFIENFLNILIYSKHCAKIYSRWATLLYARPQKTE